MIDFVDLWVYLSGEPLVWLTATLVAYVIADWISLYFNRHPVANPVLISVVLVSAVLYAINLILQRQQAQVAKPLEIATFQGALTALVLLPVAPLFLAMPQLPATWGTIAAAAVLSTLGLLLLAWSYARAEAQVLVPVEYSGFAWAALFGWVLFGEEVRLTTLAGATLIVVGCWIAAPRRHSEQVATSAPGVEGT